MLHGCQLRSFRIGVLVCILLAALPVRASLPSDALVAPPYGLFLQPGTAQTDGSVTALAQDDSALYMAGTFTYVGPLTGGLTMLDPSTGAIIPGMPMVNGTVQAIAPDGAGGWFIGGSFNRVGDAPRRNLAHIRAGYSVDPGWQPDLTWPVYALAVGPGRLYVGGGIRADGTVGLEALDSGSGTRADWNPPTLRSWVSGGVAHGSVDQLVAAGDAIIVRGSYKVGTQTTYCCESLILDRASGAARALPAGLLVGLQPLAASGTMLYLLDGWDIRALNLATGALLPWRTPVIGDVTHAATVSDGATLYLAGRFTQVCSKPRSGLAALDTLSGRVLPWAPTVSGAIANIVVDGSTVVATGVQAGARRPFVATIDRQSGAADAHELALNGPVSTLDASSSALVAGGRFSSSGGALRQGLAALDLRNGQAIEWVPGALDGAVHALASDDGVVYVGGAFTHASGVARANLAALSSATGRVLPWNPTASDRVDTLAVSGTLIYVGGAFTSVGGRAQPYLAAIDTRLGLATSWSPVVSDPVTAIAVSGNTLYAASGARVIAFDVVTGQQRWSASPEGFLSSGSLVVSDGSIYAAGQTSLVALESAGGALRFTVRAWRAAEVLHGVVYAPAFGGDSGGYWRDDLRAYDATTGRESSAVRAAGHVLAIQGTGDMLAIGGDFWGIDAEPRSGIALFHQVALPEQMVLPLIVQ